MTSAINFDNDNDDGVHLRAKKITKLLNRDESAHFHDKHVVRAYNPRPSFKK